jgi:hypothetical protein
MPWEALGKCLLSIGVICLTLSISPSRAFFDSGDSWLVQQIKWLQRYPHLKDFTGTVSLNPRLLYPGLFLSLLGVLLT